MEARTVKLYFINLSNSKNFIFEYNDGKKNIKNKILGDYLQCFIYSNSFSFKISNKNIEKNYSILLSSKYENKIGIYLENTFDLYNINFIIKNKSNKNPYFLIDYSDIQKKIEFKCDFNTLNLDKFILLNTPLNFKLFSIEFRNSICVEKKKKLYLNL